jgi:hypothetical protein
MRHTRIIVLPIMADLMHLRWLKKSGRSRSVEKCG